MAKVYKAFDTHLENEVAVKVIRTDQLVPAMLDKTLKRFEREAKEVAKLSHPNIVHVIDYGEHDGMPYLVMQYLHGGTLKKLLGTPMPYQQAAALLIPIALALEYAHQHKMVHRDVKPSNILITDSGEPMLTDFGIVKMLDVEDGATLTGTGVGLGTPEYMAPEQWMGDFSPSVDQYSLGVVFYELVTGHKPYSADTPAAVLLKQASDPLPRPGSFVAGLPENVEHVLLKSLAKNPADRCANMGELANALQRLKWENEFEVEKTITAELPAVQPLVKKEPVVEEKDTSATVMESKPLPPKLEIPEKQVVPAVKQPVKQLTKTASRKVKPWVFVLGGVGVLVVVGVILGITQGWFAGQKQVSPGTFVTGPDVTNPVVDYSKYKICLVTDAGGIDDKGFNQIAWQGVEYAIGKFGLQGTYSEPANETFYKESVDTFIKDKCDLIIGVGYLLRDAIEAAAKSYPDQKFSGVDFSFIPPYANVVGQEFQIDQSSFLAGYLAAGMTKSGVVGTYGGVDVPPVRELMDGFARGVEYYNSIHQTKVTVIGWNNRTISGLFVGTFDDYSKGKSMAESLLRSKVDVIFPVAGTIVGKGTVDFVNEYGNGAWVIGIDTDWNILMPEFSKVILTSVLKNTDVSTFNVIVSVVDDSFKGGTIVGTLSNGGVGLAPLSSAIPANLAAELDQVKQDIIGGKIQMNPEYQK